MVKRYLVSEDKFSGKVVIICKSEEVMVDVYKPTIQDINANMYLYREYPAKYEIKTQYTIEAYFDYKEGIKCKQRFDNLCLGNSYKYRILKFLLQFIQLFRNAVASVIILCKHLLSLSIKPADISFR